MNREVANIVFNPFVNDSRVIKESKSLARNGYKVEVIAHLNKGLKAYEEIEDYKIYRYSYLDRKVTKGVLGKLKAFLIYAKKTIHHVKQFDYIHCNDLITLPIGVIVKKLYNKNIKLVYDAHEYETEINGLYGKKKTLVKWLEKLLIKYADGVITVSDSIADEYVRLYNIKKPTLVLNTPYYQRVEKKNIFRETLGIADYQVIFLYQGGISKGRGVEMLLNAFKQNPNKNQVIVFMGYGELESMVQQASKDFGNIYYHPAVSPDILLDYTSSADYGISLIENTCLSYYYCLPNKMFEYIMAGISPVVSDLPEMRKVVENYQIGFVIKKNTEEELLDFLQKSELQIPQIEQNLREAQEFFNWENQEKELMKLYNTL